MTYFSHGLGNRKISENATEIAPEFVKFSLRGVGLKSVPLKKLDEL